MKDIIDILYKVEKIIGAIAMGIAGACLGIAIWGLLTTI